MKLDLLKVDQSFIVGLGILDNQGQRHIGFIYLDDKQTVYKICHFCWHRVLRNENLRNDDYTVESLKIEETNQTYLVSALDLVTNLNSNHIPYGFRVPIQVFDNEYRYVGNGLGEGLTCATFVKSIFTANGYRIIDEGTWQIRDEDIQWQNQIVDTLKRDLNIVDLEHIKEMEKSIGKVVRFRPEQVYVAGVGGESDWPLRFEDADSLAQKIVQQITSLC